jgi:hypothetical protein
MEMNILKGDEISFIIKVFIDINYLFFEVLFILTLNI